MSFRTPCLRGRYEFKSALSALCRTDGLARETPAAGFGRDAGCRPPFFCRATITGLHTLPAKLQYSGLRGLGSHDQASYSLDWVCWLASGARELWGNVGTVLHTLFGVFMLAAAVFSGRSWNPAVPFDRIEDLFHSVAATAMGFTFAIGVFAVFYLRSRSAMKVRWLDVVAMAASILIPIALSFRNDVAGGLQRVMFVMAYLWYGREASLALRPGERHSSPA